MNRMLARAAKALGWIHRNPTDAQYAGEACILCGDPLRRAGGDYHRRSYGFLGLRHRVYACETSCILEVIDDVVRLFSDAIPADQPVCLWHLGVDDNPLTTAPDRSDMFDQAYADEIDAGPKWTVEIVHGDGVLTTRPIPVRYAERIAAQAMRLGYTAMIDDEVKAS